MWSFFVCVEVLVFAVSGLLVRYYAAPSVPKTARLVTFYAYATSLTIAALVPIDVYATLTGRAETGIGTTWSVMYWSTQCLTWALVPVFQNFSDSGSFTTSSKLYNAVRDTAAFFLLMGFASVFGVLVLVAFGQLSFSSLPYLAVFLSNTFGLVVGLLLLGYGLVLMPRVLWQRADPSVQLMVACHRAGQLYDKLSSSAVRLHRAMTAVVVCRQNIHPRHRLNPLMDLTWTMCETDSPIKPSKLRADGVSADDVESWELDYDNCEASLARLRQRVKLAVNAYTTAKVQYADTIRLVWKKEQICKCRDRRYYFPPPGHPMGPQNKWIWMYKCVAHEHVQRGFAVLFGALSAMIIWSEATIATGRSPDLSPFSLLIHAGHYGEFKTQMVVLLPLLYIVAGTYFGLFHFGFFDFYRLTHASTDAKSLLLNGSLMCRFIPALCFNALHVIRMNKSVNGDSTVFAEKMGEAAHEQDLPVIGEFNIWFPLFLVAHAAAIFFNVWDRLFGTCIPSKYRFHVDSAEENTYYHRGRAVVRCEYIAALEGKPMGHALTLGPEVFNKALSDSLPKYPPDIEAPAASGSYTPPAPTSSEGATVHENPTFAPAAAPQPMPKASPPPSAHHRSARPPVPDSPSRHAAAATSAATATSAHGATLAPSTSAPATPARATSADGDAEVAAAVAAAAKAQSANEAGVGHRVAGIMQGLWTKGVATIQKSTSTASGSSDPPPRKGRGTLDDIFDSMEPEAEAKKAGEAKSSKDR